MPVNTETYLVDLDEYLRELERIKAEFDAKIELLDSQIATLAAEIAEIEEQVSYWGAKVDEAEGQVAIWRERKAKADNLVWAVTNQPSPVLDRKLDIDGYRYVKAAVYAAMPAWEPYGAIFTRRVTHPDRDTYPGGHKACVDVELPEGESCLVGYCRQGDLWLQVIAAEKIQVAEDGLALARSQCLAARDALESRTRHMRDLKLARDGALEERRGAIALWEAEYYAAQERKRIEIESIARDVKLGYPTMDAETARVIAESAYVEALTVGLTRVADALEIAMELADDWYKKQEFPHYTRDTITCPGCNSTLEITKSDIAEHNRDLACPLCSVTPVGRGVLVRVIDVWVEPPPPTPPPTPVFGIADWLKANWPWLVGGGLGVTAIVALAGKRREVRYIPSGKP